MQSMINLLFLSDSYDHLDWDPYRKSILRFLAYLTEIGEIRLLVIKANDFFYPMTSIPYSDSKFKLFKNTVSAFLPDIVLTVNRAGFCPEIRQMVKPSTKIITWFFDSYQRLNHSLLQFNNQDYVFLYGDGEHKEVFIREHKAHAEKVFVNTFGVDTFFFKANDNQPKETEICFMGTAFYNDDFHHLFRYFSENKREREIFLKAFYQHRHQYIYNFRDHLIQNGVLLNKEYLGLIQDKFPHQTLNILDSTEHMQRAVDDQISIQTRIRYLSALKQFNLKFYGEPVSNWVKVISYCDDDLLQHYAFRGTRSHQELVDIYNSAKIALNIQHHQASAVGLPYRIYEAMACKCLLMTHHACIPPLRQLGFIENQDFIAFENEEDLKYKTAAILKDEEKRLDIVNSAFKKIQEQYTLQKVLANIFTNAEETHLSDYVSQMEVSDTISLNLNSIIHAYTLKSGRLQDDSIQEPSIIQEHTISYGGNETKTKFSALAQDQKVIVYLRTRLTKKYRLNISLNKTLVKKPKNEIKKTSGIISEKKSLMQLQAKLSKRIRLHFSLDQIL